MDGRRASTELTGGERDEVEIGRAPAPRRSGAGVTQGPLRRIDRTLGAASVASLILWLAGFAPGQAVAGTLVRFDTDQGTFDVHLFDAAMPVTVANFLNYVEDGRYDGSVVHRASDIPGPIPVDFVIQGGGFFLTDPVPPDTVLSFATVVTDPPIADEPGGGVAGPSNMRGTIAMAKSGPDTVTSQWFVNQDDNSFLDDPLRADGGFSAFGLVLGDGMDVVDAIGALPLPPDFGFAISAPFSELPLQDFTGSSIEDIREINTVVVWSVSVVPEPTSALVPGLCLLALLGKRRHGKRSAR